MDLLSDLAPYLVMFFIGCALAFCAWLVSRILSSPNRWRPRGPGVVVLLILGLAGPLGCVSTPQQKRETAAALTRADTSADGYRAWLKSYIATLTAPQLEAAEQVHRRAWDVLLAHDRALGACLGTMQPAPARAIEVP